MKMVRRASMWSSMVVLCGLLALTTSVHLPPVYPADISAFIRDDATYDFIVAGAGAAGCAVAARLSVLGASVLLLEAGTDPDIRSRIPSLSASLLASNVDWHYETLPNGKSCLASQGQQCRFSRGKALGGSTAINYMMYTRGNRRDYDNWNITGWAWDDIKPYFLKFENLKVLDQLPASSAPFHNTSGPMEIEFFTDSRNDWHQRIIDGFKDLNFPYNYDVNAESQIGISQVIGYVNDGERETSARGYLSPATLRRNLHVAKNAHVTGVILNDNNEAIGVRAILAGNRNVKVYASKEVIVSAGAIGTPQILMLSGIGPAEHLKSKGIPVRVDLPEVGDGLSDHILPLVFVQVERGFGIKFPKLIPFLNDGVYVTQWLATQDGPYASNGLTDTTAFINSACYDFKNHRLSDKRSKECEIPTLQFIHAYIDLKIIPTVEQNFTKFIGLNDDAYEQIKVANVNKSLIMVFPILLTPKSRGWVRLNSSDPLAPPSIFPNYLDKQEDMDELLQGIRIVEDLKETDPFKKHDASILKLKFKACSGLEDGSDEYWKCYIRQMTRSMHQGMCTTALGRVVDEELRVKGVRRLRVADGSVIPVLPRGNTAAACIAIGEKAADLLAREHYLYGNRLINL